MMKVQLVLCALADSWAATVFEDSVPICLAIVTTEHDGFELARKMFVLPVERPVSKQNYTVITLPRGLNCEVHTTYLNLLNSII